MLCEGAAAIVYRDKIEIVKFIERRKYMLIVDLVIVAIILLCVGLGYKRGLTGCLLK